MRKRCSACKAEKERAEFYRGGQCRECVKARTARNFKARYVASPRAPSSLVPPAGEAPTKVCIACSEEKPADAFYLHQRRDGSVTRKGRCGACIQARRPSKSAPKTEKRCNRCGEVKPLTDAHFSWKSGENAKWASVCKPCAAAVARKNYRGHCPLIQRHVRPEIEVRHILDPDLDRLRKALAKASRPLLSEEERLAYLRGYFAAQALREREGSAVEAHQDLVFRIASELRRHSYEDRVSLAFEALLECVRSGVVERDELATAIRAKIEATAQERRLVTNQHDCGANGDWDKIAEIAAPELDELAA